MTRAIAAFACWTVLSLILAQPAGAAVAAKVTLAQDQTSYTLDNGIVAARISKTTGDLLSLKYEKQEMLGANAAHAGGRWRLGPPENPQTVSAITIDPNGNMGQRAEVMVRGTISDAPAQPAGAAPAGAAPAAAAGFLIDSEIRYCLGRGEYGIYTYQSLVHHGGYSQFAPPIGDFSLRLNGAIFDRVSIDNDREKAMPSVMDWIAATPLNIPQARRIKTGKLAGQVECGFDYDAIPFDTRVWGWASTSNGVGIWIINPSVEYMQGPVAASVPTVYRNEDDGAPILVNHWAGDIGASPPTVPLNVSEGQTWSKVIGPFFIYCNKGSRPDAVAAAARESSAWPYDWVKDVDYTARQDRAVVRGQFVFKNPPVNLPAPQQTTLGYQHGQPAIIVLPPQVLAVKPAMIDESPLPHLLVGLVPHVNARTTFDESWQHDAFAYQFWAASTDGQHFVIPNVRPGLYDLYATADNILGPFVTQLISVQPGKVIDVGKMEWIPKQYGIPFWEIGYPNRSGDKFFRGNAAHHWGAWQLYSADFPSGVNFIAEQNDYRKAWNYQQPPGSTWHIRFKLYSMPPGTRTWLRIALAGGSENAKLRVAINNHEITANEQTGKTAEHRMEGNHNILHDEVRGYWEQRVYPVSPAWRSIDDNVIDLNVTGPAPTDGVIYDYLRFEVDQPAVNPTNISQQPQTNVGQQPLSPPGTYTGRTIPTPVKPTPTPPQPVR